MTSLLLSPHQDDETLFAAQLCLRHRPHVIVCTESVIQEADGITNKQRNDELASALKVLGVWSWHQWPVPDSRLDSNLDSMALWLSAWLPENPGPSADHVFAPLVEDEGHEHHSAIGQLALDVFGPTRVTSYATYQRGAGRTHTDTEVKWEPGWRAKKLAAMACYVSQIELASTRPWFAQDDMLREFVA